MEPVAVIGVTGGIAAYRIPDLVRRLRHRGWTVHVLMTEAACRFITPLTMQTVSENPVAVDMFAEPPVWNVQHVAYARQADIVMIAPASATTLARLVGGFADDMVSATALATRAPVLVAPAMNSAMWEKAAVQENVSTLRRRGVHVLLPDTGELVCGEEGEGRLPALDTLEQALVGRVEKDRSWQDRVVLVTAGPTREPLDAVRFLSNPSTGKMGVAVARAAVRRGARVVLVHGPLQVPVPPGVTAVPVETAAEMYREVMERYAGADVIVKSAAVSDYRPRQRLDYKVKKADAASTLALEPTPDILAALGQCKERKILVGFAAETHHIEEYGWEKLRSKNLDFLVVNDVSAPETGFASDTNRALLLSRNGQAREIALMSKDALAEELLDQVGTFLNSENAGSPPG